LRKIYFLAVLMAIVTGVSVYLFAQSLEGQGDVPEVEMGQVVVALTSIPANTQITEDLVTLVQMPSQWIHSQAATALHQVVGSVARTALLPQEQILIPRLGIAGEEDDALAYTLQSGERAISIAVDDVSGVSGYIAEGDRVDVIVTVIYPSDGTTSGYAVSSLMAQNLLVLKTGLHAADAADTGAVYTTVTLAVSPEQAVRINFAATNGKVRLALRPVLDEESVEVDDFPTLPPKQAASAEGA